MESQGDALRRGHRRASREAKHIAQERDQAMAAAVSVRHIAERASEATGPLAPGDMDLLLHAFAHLTKAVQLLAEGDQVGGRYHALIAGGHLHTMGLFAFRPGDAFAVPDWAERAREEHERELFEAR